MAKQRKQQPSAEHEAAVAASVAAHPRAVRNVRRAKGWGGLVGFTIAGLASLQAGVPAFDVGLRALMAGMAAYLLAWGVAVTVWRHLVVAELRAVHDELQPQRAARRRADGSG
jgi:hypothetical protein